MGRSTSQYVVDLRLSNFAGSASRWVKPTHYTRLACAFFHSWNPLAHSVRSGNRREIDQCPRASSPPFRGPDQWLCGSRESTCCVVCSSDSIFFATREGHGYGRLWIWNTQSINNKKRKCKQIYQPQDSKHSRPQNAQSRTGKRSTDCSGSLRLSSQSKSPTGPASCPVPTLHGRQLVFFPMAFAHFDL